MRRLLSMIAVLAVVLAACGDTATTTTIQAEEPAASAPSTTSAPATTQAPVTTQAPATTEAAQASGDGAGILTAAAQQSSDALSGRFEATTEITSAEFGEEPVTMTISGAFAGDDVYTMTMDMSEIMAASDDIPQGFDDFEEIVFIVDGEDAYMSFALFSLLGVTTEWVKMPIDQTDETVGFGASGPTSPTSILDDFTAAGATVTEVGTETIRGVETTHYLVEFDAAALETLEDTTSRAFAESGAEDVPVDIWIGDDGYLYQFELSVEDENGTTHMIYNIYDYGENIEVTIPAAEDVTDFGDLGIPTLPTG